MSCISEGFFSCSWRHRHRSARKIQRVYLSELAFGAAFALYVIFHHGSRCFYQRFTASNLRCIDGICDRSTDYTHHFSLGLGRAPDAAASWCVSGSCSVFLPSVRLFGARLCAVEFALVHHKACQKCNTYPLGASHRS